VVVATIATVGYIFVIKWIRFTKLAYKVLLKVIKGYDQLQHRL